MSSDSVYQLSGYSLVLSVIFLGTEFHIESRRSQISEKELLKFVVTIVLKYPIYSWLNKVDESLQFFFTPVSPLVFCQNEELVRRIKKRVAKSTDQ